jgi:Co/Zn/Cd efflux system component
MSVRGRLPLLDDQRAALALIAIITGFMAAIQGVSAMPAGSTVLFASALIFIQHSISAILAFWVAMGVVSRKRWMIQLQGIAMVLLGGLVFAVALRWLRVGSHPWPQAMVLLGTFALIASLACGAIMLRHRGARTDLPTVWRLSRTDAVSNIAVVAAGFSVALTRSNIPDLVIGGAMAAFFVLSGWRIAQDGQISDRPSP